MGNNPERKQSFTFPTIRDLQKNGLTNADVRRLIKYRQKYRKGSGHEETPDSKRLSFAKWLLEHRRIGEGVSFDRQESDIHTKETVVFEPQANTVLTADESEAMINLDNRGTST